MSDLVLFEYAVIRLVPRVEREEFLNIGVILYCARRKFLKALLDTDSERLRVFAPITDFTEVDCYLKSFNGICQGQKEGSPIAELPIAERFRWLTATRSTIIQTSKVHTGLCADPQQKLHQIFEEMVAAASL